MNRIDTARKVAVPTMTPATTCTARRVRSVERIIVGCIGGKARQRWSGRPFTSGRRVGYCANISATAALIVGSSSVGLGVDRPVGPDLEQAATARRVQKRHHQRPTAYCGRWPDASGFAFTSTSVHD